MESLELHKRYSVEEYFSIEESGDVRNEYIDGKIIEKPAESREHHFICQNLLLIFENLLESKGFEVFMGSMKIKIPNENHYYYPDIFITREEQTDDNKYVQFEPELIVEVLSETTRMKDMTDKFIQYRKINSLDYYLLVEPEKYLVLLNFKNENLDWEMTSFTKEEEVITLPKLNVTIEMTDIYKK